MGMGMGIGMLFLGERGGKDYFILAYDAKNCVFYG